VQTYKKDTKTEALSYDLHFWLGSKTSQDEAATAAYKTVELDDHLDGIPVQYREVQGFESGRFLTYFSRFTCLHGGVSTGFHHVSAPPPMNLYNLYQIATVPHLASTARPHISVRQVAPDPSSLMKGDVFVLDLGERVLQFNTKESSGKERFFAAEFAKSIVDGRPAHCELTVCDEGGQGSGIFLSALGLDSLPSRKDAASPSAPDETPALCMYRLSDSTGTLLLEAVAPPEMIALSSSDVFLVDATQSASAPAVYVWIGNQASFSEKRHAVQFAQGYLHDQKAKGRRVSPAISTVKIREGHENSSFLEAFQRK